MISSPQNKSAPTAKPGRFFRDVLVLYAWTCGLASHCGAWLRSRFNAMRQLSE